MLLDVTALHWPIFVVQFASIAGDGGRSSSFFIFILNWVHPTSKGNFPYNLSLGRIISHKVTTITVGPSRNWMYFGWNLKIANWNFQWNATTRVVRLKFSAASSKTQTWTTNSGRQISLPSFFCIFQLSVLYFAKTQPVWTSRFQRYISFKFLTMVFYICNLDSNLSC